MVLWVSEVSSLTDGSKDNPISVMDGGQEMERIACLCLTNKVYGSERNKYQTVSEKNSMYVSFPS